MGTFLMPEPWPQAMTRSCKTALFATVQGTVTGQDSSHLEMELGELLEEKLLTTVKSNMQRASIAHCNGTLSVALISGFAPVCDMGFDLFDFDVSDGQFGVSLTCRSCQMDCRGTPAICTQPVLCEWFPNHLLSLCFVLVSSACWPTLGGNIQYNHAE